LHDIESYRRDLDELDTDMSSVIVAWADYSSSREVDKKFKEFDNYELPEV